MVWLHPQVQCLGKEDEGCLVSTDRPFYLVLFRVCEGKPEYGELLEGYSWDAEVQYMVWFGLRKSMLCACGTGKDEIRNQRRAYWRLFLAMSAE